MAALSFTLPQLLSFLGVVQCVYVLVYIAFRTKKLKHIVLPFLYFIVLGCAFLSDFSYAYLFDFIAHYDVVSWGLWLSIIPLSALLVIQMSHLQALPSWPYWLSLLVIPVAYALSYYISAETVADCFAKNYACPDFYMWLNITGAVGGAASLLFIWLSRDVFVDILNQKAGKERYWLILTLIIVNIIFLSLMIVLSAKGESGIQEIALLRIVFGLAFVYLVSTSLLRIYPSALKLTYKRQEEKLSASDQAVIDKIDHLIKVEKVYHEATYSRSDLARELGVAEPTVSRLINVHYSRSFPQLLNEHRVEDAKRLLLDTNENIKVVSEEVGFNSVTSFNRAFKDITGQSAGTYRKNMIK